MQTTPSAAADADPGRRRRRLGGGPRQRASRSLMTLAVLLRRLGAPHRPDQLSSAPPRSGPHAPPACPPGRPSRRDHRRLADRRARSACTGTSRCTSPTAATPGPFANPAHFLILFGLFGVFIAGFCAIVLPRGQAEPAAVRTRRGLVRAARRHRAARGQRLRPARLPARRLLAPDLRPGRDALGPDPPDDDRRRGARLRRPGHPARRGARSPSASPIARTGAALGVADLARARPRTGADGRLPDRAQHVPGASSTSGCRSSGCSSRRC